MTSTSLGKKIKDARKRTGMTQADVAEKMSISVQAVSQWETDRTIPNYRNLQDLKRLIGMSIEDDFKAVDFIKGIHSSWEEPDVAVRAPVVEWRDPDQWGNLEVDADEEENPFRWIADDFLEVRWKPVGDVYALKVKNSYLAPEFSLGDFVIIDTGRAAEKNDIVAVEMADNRVYLGRYIPLGFDQHRAQIFELHANSSQGEVPYKRVDTENPGRVVGVVREQRRYFRMD